MPFASYRQFRFLMARHPEIAKKWIAEGYRPPKKPKGYKPGKKIKVRRKKKSKIIKLAYQYATRRKK